MTLWDTRFPLPYIYHALYFILPQQSEKGGTAVTTVIKKSGAENRLMEFFPSINQQQTEENFAKSFAKKDLPEVVAFRKQVYDIKILLKVLYLIKFRS